MTHITVQGAIANPRGDWNADWRNFLKTVRNIIYKIVDAGEWDAASRSGEYAGSADDLRDGYIHFSTAEQVRATAEKYFKNCSGLLLIGVNAEDFGAALKWEPARGGALFPHLYAKLPVRAAASVHALELDSAGIPQIHSNHLTSGTS